MQQAVCVRGNLIPGEKNEKNRHHEIHSSSATATSSRRLDKKFVPRVSPYSRASAEPEFVEIGLIQLSQSVNPTNVTHTHKTDREKD